MSPQPSKRQSQPAPTTERSGTAIGDENISRRTAVRLLGTVLAGPAGGAQVILAQRDEPLPIPASQGYLLVDPKKCQGCQNCMAACSLVHHGSVNLSLARIQIIHDHLGVFPADAIVAQCRQCVEPACVKACPTEALHCDSRFGNIRTVDAEKCIGCRECFGACPYSPSRPIWNHQSNRAQKCDLCADAPHWGARGGPGGKQACVEVCPMRAIQYTQEIPAQSGDRGYLVNLRGQDWERFGLTTAP